MSAGELNIYIEQGADWVRTALIKENDVALDLTNYTFEGKFQHRIGDGLTTPFTFTKLPTLGYVLIEMPAATTLTLQAEKGIYDWTVTNTVTGRKIRIANGTAFISRKVA